ncbi:hypothetical protein [Phascolarctobacterium faecium]|jgi:hypothetical protein|nr:MAG TPA: hypothetical protein [Caudoviricetes sp.]
MWTGTCGLLEGKKNVLLPEFNSFQNTNNNKTEDTNCKNNDNKEKK